MKKLLFYFLFFFIIQGYSSEKIDLGIDAFFKENKQSLLNNKKVALLINHTSVNNNLEPSIDVFFKNAKKYKIIKVFSPEHGFNGSDFAGEKVDNSKKQGLDIYSLHGEHKRPTSDMLKNVDVIICDIQEIGCRSYTYATTLYYVMEEAAKKNIKVIVLDRPNPINGITIDGPMLDEKKYRSFLGYKCSLLSWYDNR